MVILRILMLPPISYISPMVPNTQSQHFRYLYPPTQWNERIKTLLWFLSETYVFYLLLSPSISLYLQGRVCESSVNNMKGHEALSHVPPVKLSMRWHGTSAKGGDLSAHTRHSLVIFENTIIPTPFHIIYRVRGRKCQEKIVALHSKYQKWAISKHDVCI